MKYSIIIPTFSNFNGLNKCLDSVIKNSNLNETEIIVIANGSPKDTQDYIASTNIKSQYYPDPIGYPSAINAGIDISEGEYIILLNDDTEILNNNWISMLEEPLL